MFRACILGCMLLACGCLLAQGGPPLRTDDPGTPGNGNWEINLAVTSERRAGERVFEAPIADINYGVGDRLQLKLEIPWVVRGSDHSPTKSGLGNTLLGVKWRFLEGKWHDLQVSTYPQIELNNPTHSVERGLVERGARFLLPIEASAKLGPVQVNPEAGYWLSQRERHEFFVGVAAGRSVTKRLETVGEAYSIGTAEGRDTTFGVGTRVALRPYLRLIVMAGRRFAASEDEPTFIGYGGLQFNIERHRPDSGNPHPF